MHDLRVACRRLSEAIDLESGGRGPRLAKSARDGVAAVRRSAGKVRDCDVWMEWLAGVRPRAGAEASAVETLLENGARRRKKGVERFRSRLRRIRISRLKKTLASLTRSRKGRKKARRDASAPDRAALRTLLAARSERAAAIADRAARTGDAEEMHEARIAFKRLRYTAEAMVSPGPHSGKRAGTAALLDSLKKIQDVLGALHDRDVFLDEVARRGERIVSMTKPRKLREEIRLGFEALSSRLSRERERLLVGFRRLEPGRVESAVAKSTRFEIAAQGARPRRRIASVSKAVSSAAAGAASPGGNGA